MLFKGYADYSQLKDSTIYLGGWCYFWDESKVYFPDRLYITDKYGNVVADNQNITRVFRNDLMDKLDGMLGYFFTLEDVSMFHLLINSEMKIYGTCKGETSELIITDRIKHQNKVLLSQFFMGQAHKHAPKLVSQSIKELSKLTVTQVELQAPYKEFTSINPRVGTMSADGVAVIGYDGYLFLYSGSNVLIDQYKKRDPERENKWLRLFGNNIAYFENRSTAFLQVIIPEKQTMVPGCFPVAIETPTHTYKVIREYLNSPAASKFSIDAYDILDKKSKRKQVFKKADTHMAYHGVESIICAIFTKLGYEPPVLPIKFYRIWKEGDLGQKFLTTVLAEDLEVPDEDSWAFAKIKPKLIFDNKLEDKHVGIKRIYTNDKAVVDKYVMVFGSSSTGGGDDPLHLLWWLSRYFSKVYFIWQINIEFDLIEQEKPDIVLFQTIERFL